MSNKEEHFAAGSITGLLTGLMYQFKRFNNQIEQTPGEALFNVIKCTLIGGISATLPDKLEPPNSPNHRSLAHSLFSAGIISLAELKMIKNGNIPIWLEEVFASVGNGYLSHLLLDSSTSKGLPTIE